MTILMWEDVQITEDDPTIANLDDLLARVAACGGWDHAERIDLWYEGRWMHYRYKTINASNPPTASMNRALLSVIEVTAEGHLQIHRVPCLLFAQIVTVWEGECG